MKLSRTAVRRRLEPLAGKLAHALTSSCMLAAMLSASSTTTPSDAASICASSSLRYAHVI